MASTSLTWTPSGAGSQQKTTLSMWLKKSVDSNAGYIFEVSDGTNQFIIRESNAQIKFWHWNGSAYQFEAEITPLLRDVSGWYNFVMSIDTTLGTQADRLKCWLNGVSETVTFTSGSMPQNANYIFNKNSQHRWGRADNNYWNGLMSHLHQTDGYCYDASTFGSIDNITGEWQINATPSVANYGTNGYFILKDGNSVTDQSPNTNNFTVATGNLTFTHDNPSNVFATLNDISGRSHPTLEHGANSCSNSASDGHRVYGTIPSKAGYYEVKLGLDPVGSSGKGFEWGVNDFSNYNESQENISSVRRMKTNYGYDTHFATQDFGGGNSWEGVTTGLDADAGDILMCAWKNGKVYYGYNGTWFFSANPSNNTDGSTQVPLADSNAYQIPSGRSHLGGMGDCQFNFGNGFFGTTAITTNSGNGYADANGQGKFQYQVPTGCYACCTKNLNL
jgi:hypothetical protein